MKKIVLIYGLISGLIVCSMMAITLPLYKSGVLKPGLGEVVGYTTMAISLSLIFFGIKSYRDNQLHGAITFGKAFAIGSLIALTASLMYSVSWEFFYNIFYPDFMDQYASMCIERAKADGADGVKMQKVQHQIEVMRNIYKNPFTRFGMTVFEMLPMGVLLSLVFAGVLRKKAVTAQ